MADIAVDFDSDPETTKAKLAELVSQFGKLTWVDDRGTFVGTAVAKGVKGEASVAERGAGTSVAFSYSLPMKLKVLAGPIDSQIKKSLISAGGQVS